MKTSLTLLLSLTFLFLFSGSVYGGVIDDTFESFNEIIDKLFSKKHQKKSGWDGDKHDPLGLIPGVRREYWENGEIRTISHFKDGEKDGLETTYDKSGKIKLGKVSYKNGKREGLKKVWDINGKKSWKVFFKNGKKEGLETHWNQSGEKISETHYKNGEKEGLETTWSHTIVFRETHYKIGKKDGLETQWYPSFERGGKEYEKHFKDGIENGIRKEWYVDGTITFEGNYVDGNEEIK